MAEIELYERLLDKNLEPIFDDLLHYAGDTANLWLELEKFLDEVFNTAKTIRFPYGKDYGWGVKYSKKSKHICDVFTEKGAFSVFFRVNTSAVESVIDELGDYAKSVWEEAYPCKDGRWIDFRVTDAEQLEDIKKIICARMGVAKKEF